MENLRVTTVQYDIIWEDKTANLDKLEKQFLSQLGPSETDLIVLPEMFATGFTMSPAKFYESEDGQTFQWLKKWASKLNACLVGGLITKNSKGGYHNSLVVVWPDGNIERYDKKHLFRMGAENKHYVAGNAPKTINIKGWKVNLQVCYDLRFPVFSRNRMVNGGPLYDVLIYIANWPAVRESAWTTLLVARAIENQCFVIGVNRIGKDVNNIAHNGASAVINPSGSYNQAPRRDSQVLENSELDFSDLLNARKAFPVLQDADPFKIAEN